MICECAVTVAELWLGTIKRQTPAVRRRRFTQCGLDLSALNLLADEEVEFTEEDRIVTPARFRQTPPSL